MKLVILGTAGYHPNENRHTTCVVIPEAGIVFDAGTSFFRIPQYIETDRLDVFLSHAHLDHIAGLTFLFDIRYQHPLDVVRLHATSEKLRTVRDHLFAPDIFPLAPDYVEEPLDGEVILGDAKVSWTQLKHPGGCVGYRIDWTDRSLAFITDTTADVDAEYVDFIRGVDVLLHECNFPDGLEELANASGHSCLTPVAEVARRAEVGVLVLLHFNPLSDGVDSEALKQAEQIFSPIVAAEDGMVIEL